MDFDEIRKLVIIAMFSDDVLLERLVLKGGNAISLAHGLDYRSSIDVDFSIAEDFEDIEDIKTRIFKALKERFDSGGMNVFDEKFFSRPSVVREGQNPQWGGYQIQFKLIEKSKAVRLVGDLDGQRRNATVIGESQQRSFTIDISKFEYCSGKQALEIDHFTVYVYTAEMLVLEKLRAICQQMPEFALRNHPVPRARDFFDIHTIILHREVDLEKAENVLLMRNIFAAKNVPKECLQKIESTRAFHEPDWDSVRLTARGHLEPFSFYFDFVTGVAKRLHALWNE